MSNPKEITIEGALYRLVEQDACDAAWERRCKLYAGGDIVFLEAVIAMYGDIVLTWTAGGCTLGNGRTFKEATDEPR